MIGDDNANFLMKFVTSGVTVKVDDFEFCLPIIRKTCTVAEALQKILCTKRSKYNGICGNIIYYVSHSIFILLKIRRFRVKNRKARPAN